MLRTTETEKKLFNILSNVGDIFIVFDVETTGLSSTKDRIIQISANKFVIEDNYKLHLLSTFNEYINPGFYISERITNITGITNEFLETKPSEDDIFPLIYDYFGDQPNVAAYNSKFDVSFLSELYKRNRKALKGEITNSKGTVNDLNTAVDVLQMARDLVSKEDTTDFKLRTICESYGISEGINWHNADADVYATAQLIPIFIDEYLARNEQNIEEATVEKERAKILSICYWNGFRGHSRVYVNTNFGALYYDVISKVWGEKEEGIIDRTDMEQFREDVLNKVGVTNEEDMVSTVRKK